MLCVSKVKVRMDVLVPRELRFCLICSLFLWREGKRQAKEIIWLKRINHTKVSFSIRSTIEKNLMMRVVVRSTGAQCVESFSLDRV